MRKQHFSLLLTLAAIAVILVAVAGCTSPTQTNVAPANLTENTSTSTSSSASSAVSRTSTSSPSPSPSAIVPSSSPTPTPVPPQGKIATTIDPNKFFLTDNTVKQGSPVTLWGFNVVSQGAESHILCVPLTASIDGGPARTLPPQDNSNCFETASFGLSAEDTAKLTLGEHKLTISYVGDDTYQPSKEDFKFEVT